MFGFTAEKFVNTVVMALAAGGGVMFLFMVACPCGKDPIQDTPFVGYLMASLTALAGGRVGYRLDVPVHDLMPVKTTK